MMEKKIGGVTRLEILILIGTILIFTVALFYFNYVAYNNYQNNLMVKNTSNFENPDKLIGFKGEIRQEWLDDEIKLFVNINYEAINKPFASVNPYFKDDDKAIEITFEIPEKFKNNIDYARAHNRFVKEKLRDYKFFYEDLEEKALIDELERFNSEYNDYVKDIKLESGSREVLSLKKYR